MDILFATDHLWVRRAEKQVSELERDQPEVFEAALRGDADALGALREKDAKFAEAGR